VKVIAFLSWDSQVICQQFGYLTGGSPFIALNFPDGEYGAAYLLGQHRLGEVHGFASPPDPIAK
jgi:hypothetical protein